MDDSLAQYSRFDVDGFDADALLGVVRDTRFEQRLLAGGQFRACVQRVVFPEFSLDSGAYNLPIFASGSFGEDLIGLAMAVNSDGPMWANGRWIPAGQIMVFAEDSELNVRPRPGGWQWAVLLISRPVLQREAVTWLGRELQVPRSGWYSRTASATDAARLRRTVLNTLEDAAHPKGLVTPAQIQVQAQTLLTAFLASVAATDAGQPPRALGSYSERYRDAVVRRAENYLKTQSDRPYDSRALTTALGVGERQLERLFRDAYGHGPCQWHQMARLNLARSALRQARGQGAVTDVATRYGFGHLGRFSVMYRDVFGESPRDTLRG